MHTHPRTRGCPESLLARLTTKRLIESSAVYDETKYQAIERCSGPFWEGWMVNDRISGTSQVTFPSLVKHMPALTSPKVMTMSLGLIVQMQPRQLKINGKHITSHGSGNAIEMRASAERQQVLSPD